MADFIPINAKADISGSKKGKLTPEQNAQVNAWCLTQQTGIFDVLGKCQAENSVYTATNNVANIVFKSGFISICGRIVECEAGTNISVITPANGEASGKIIARYNLGGIKEEEFVVTTTTSALVQQNLYENPQTGIYEFELYSYIATPTSVTLTRNNTNYIKPTSQLFIDFENNFKEKYANEGKALYNYNDTKGTIEDRLTKLGFKSGTISFMGEEYSSSNNDTSQDGLFRQGNFVICKFKIKRMVTTSIAQNYLASKKTMFTLPENFRPKNNTKINVLAYRFTDNIGILSGFRISNITVQQNGNAVIDYIGADVNDFGVDYNFEINFGYEAPPID